MAASVSNHAAVARGRGGGRGGGGSITYIGHEGLNEPLPCVPDRLEGAGNEAFQAGVGDQHTAVGVPCVCRCTHPHMTMCSPSRNVHSAMMLCMHAEVQHAVKEPGACQARGRAGQGRAASCHDHLTPTSDRQCKQ